MMSGGHEVNVGGRGLTAKTMHRTIRWSALPHFRTPDFSVIEATRRASWQRKQQRIEYGRLM